MVWKDWDGWSGVYLGIKLFVVFWILGFLISSLGIGLAVISNFFQYIAFLPLTFLSLLFFWVSPKIGALIAIPFLLIGWFLIGIFINWIIKRFREKKND